MSTLPRGLRNNNPGNLNFAHQLGAVIETGVSNPRFARFPTMDDGVKALCHQLVLYFGRGINTVAKIVGQWAPPQENITSAYIAYVSQQMNVQPNTPLCCIAENLANLALAISHLENGQQPFTYSHILPLAKEVLPPNNRSILT
ncbi:MAG: structural protein [Acetobacter orientalis]|uniref:structural protein n=1 Tax=Acetobacter orientalis TaxID=146474 RepID=UPI0039ED64CA